MHNKGKFFTILQKVLGEILGDIMPIEEKIIFKSLTLVSICSASEPLTYTQKILNVLMQLNALSSKAKSSTEIFGRKKSTRVILRTKKNSI